jgi:hypothetical protein
MSVLLPLIIIAVMVSFNALFVAAEFATVGSRRSRIQQSAEGGSKQAARLLAIMCDPKRLDSCVAACQIGITLSSLVAGAYGQAQLTPLLEPHVGDWWPHGCSGHRARVDHRPPGGARRVAPQDRVVGLPRAPHHRDPSTDAMAWGAAYANSGLVFTREDGSPIHPDRFSQCSASTFVLRACDDQIVRPPPHPRIDGPEGGRPGEGDQ